MTFLQPQEIIHQRYQLEHQLGYNAGRETWLAKDLQMEGELVVVKLLSIGGKVQWEDLKLFEREAKILQQINHERIPKYHDYFSIDDRHLWFGLVQEYIQGDSLRDYLAQGHRFSAAQVKQIAIAILEILIYLHELNPQILHRDLKPSNLILTGEIDNAANNWNIYLVDFGSVQDRATPEGKSFTVVGTYGYTPIEQYGGRAVAASDLYALGATMIHLLTGLSPAELPQDDDARIMFSDRTSASADLVKWIQNLVEPMVKKRYSSARVALEKLTKPDIIPPKPSQIPDQVFQRVRPNIPQSSVLSSYRPRRIYAPVNTKIQVEESDRLLKISTPSNILSAVLLLSIFTFLFVAGYHFLTEVFSYSMAGRIDWILIAIPTAIMIFLIVSLYRMLTTSCLEINEQEIILGRYILGKCYWQVRFPRGSSFGVEPEWRMMREKYNNNLISWLIWLSSEKSEDNSIKSNVKVYIQNEHYLLGANNMRPTEVIWLIDVIDNFKQRDRLNNY
ncbi:MAG: serine/threonine protein kinase [Pseudanabaena sp.]|nr:MAG: serine/threonine protein kinase [Pseudanabaena sp.]